MTQYGPHPASSIQSIQRAVTILRSFTEAEPEWGVGQLSQHLGLHKSTVSRILSTLRHEGLVSQSPDTSKYRLSLGLISLAGVALGQIDVRRVAQPHLDALVDISQETVNLTILDGVECVTIDRAPSPQHIRYVGWIGRRTPLHCTASGKVLLAGLTPQKRQAILPEHLTEYTPKTISTRAILEKEIEQIQAQGYVVVHEEFETGFSGIAAPIYDRADQTIAAISIAGPTYRMGDAQINSFVEPLVQVTHLISTELGCVGR